ncbi:MAG: GAF domain-containing protein [Acidobacteriota bacterium]
MNGSSDLERRLRELQLLHETSVRLTSLRDVGSLLSEIVEQLRRVLDVEIVSVMLLDPEENVLRIAAASGLADEIVANARVAVGDGISGWVAAQGRPVLIEDMSKDPHFGPSPFSEQYTTSSLLCVPLRIADKVLGVINVNNKPSRQPLDEQDLALVTTFSAQAVLALENSRLYSNLEAEVERVTAELKEANVELREIQEFNESILSHMSSGLVALDLDGRITMINRAAQTLMAVSEEEMLDQPLATLFGEEVAPIISGAPEDEGERREALVKAHDDRELRLGFSVSPLRDADEAEIGLVVLFRDLTRLKQMETELVRMDRLASLGILGAGLAHEIRNPLAAIRFNLGFLREIQGSSTELEVIVKNVNRLEELVKELLRFARPQPPSFHPGDLNRCVITVAALLDKQAAASGIEIEVDADEELPRARIDAPQVEQAVLNVALNGIQAMKDQGGRLVLCTRRSAKGTHLEIVIADEGPGLSAEAAANVFDPFYSTKEEGTGLGLAVTHRIVQDHEGYIEVRPEGETSGATFALGFPVAEG